MSTPPLHPTVKKLVAAGRDQLWLWFIPTLALTILASFYCMIRQPTWRAEQGLLVRDESGSAEGRQGRFDSVDTMKAAQETIMEVARSRMAVEAALRQLGPPADKKVALPWPSDEDIEAMRERITVTPPKGAEFGHTEVIYLAVTGPSREEAVRRTNVVCEQMEVQLAKIRSTRAQSVISELRNTVANATRELNEATRALQELEQDIGPDLAELRSLNDRAGEGNLQQTLNLIITEIRGLEATQQGNEQLKELLVSAERDPEKFLATPNRLLESQPALRRLKEGLVDAQLQTSRLLGSMKRKHPLADAALRSEQEIWDNIRDELKAALRGVETELMLGARQIAGLQQQQRDLQARFDRLTGLRVHYGNLVDARQSRIAILQRAKSDLAEAEASQNAAFEASLLTRIDEPVAGNKPVGPSNSLIVLAGFGGGLATGASLLVLTIPMGSGSGRRWSDYVGWGRRASDQGNRRRSDAQGAPPTVSPPPAGAEDCKRRVHDQPGLSKTDRRYGVRRREDRDEDDPAAKKG